MKKILAICLIGMFTTVICNAEVTSRFNVAGQDQKQNQNLKQSEQEAEIPAGCACACAKVNVSGLNAGGQNSNGGNGGQITDVHQPLYKEFEGAIKQIKNIKMDELSDAEKDIVKKVKDKDTELANYNPDWAKIAMETTEPEKMERDVKLGKYDEYRWNNGIEELTYHDKNHKGEGKYSHSYDEVWKDFGPTMAAFKEIVKKHSK